MDDITLLKLKILVERAVRPVRADMTRKRRMRDELLAHLIEAFEDEMSRLGDAQIALERTAQRMGDPAELTRQLQESAAASRCIFWIEQWMDPIFVGPVWQRAVKFSLLAFAVFTGLVIPVLVLQRRLNEWPVTIAPPMMVFGAVVMLNWMRAALESSGWRRWLRAGVVGILSAFGVPAVTFAVCLMSSANPGLSLRMAASLLPANLVLTPAILVLIAFATAEEIRYQREWANLQIE